MPDYKMKMGSKQKDTDGNFSEKDSKMLSESQVGQIASAINKKWGGTVPTPEGIDTGKYSKFVERSANKIQEGGPVPTYKAKKGVTKEQFENYAGQIKKANPKSKAIFKYK